MPSFGYFNLLIISNYLLPCKMSTLDPIQVVAYVFLISIHSQDPLKLTGVKQLECYCDPIRIVNALRCLTWYQLTDNGLSKTTRVMTINQCQSIANGEDCQRLWCMLVLCGLRELAGQYGRGDIAALGLSRFHRVTHFCASQVA